MAEQKHTTDELFIIGVGLSTLLVGLSIVFRYADND